MKRCIIITGYIEGSIRTICPELCFTGPSDPSGTSPFSGSSPLILCADGGYRLAGAEHITPHVIIGDFDTFDDQQDDRPDICNPPGGAGEVIRVPVEKDDTDTMLCVKYGLHHGCSSFLIVGGIGGRLDHTFANLQALAYLVQQGAEAFMKDEETCITIKTPGTFSLHPGDFPGADSDFPGADGACRSYRRFSLFSWSPVCEGLSIRGAKYNMENGRLEQTCPLGVSNEFDRDEVQIEFADGLLLVIMNRQR